MAYRFDGSDDLVEFAITPFNGYTFGPLTFAAMVKRASVGWAQRLLFFGDSGLSTKIIHRFDGADANQLATGAFLASGQTVTSTTVWQLVAATWAGGTAIPRLHVHNGTSWNHANAAAGSYSNVSAITGTDRVTVSSSSPPFHGDITCVAAKKADSSDAAIETLSHTAFQAWRDFGFDWLIGFDATLESAGVLQDQGAAGTGDEIAITGTTLVSDPSGWSWAPPPEPEPFTHIKFGTGLTVTDEGDGVIRVDAT